jgi:phosphate transport system permease protein
MTNTAFDDFQTDDSDFDMQVESREKTGKIFEILCLIGLSIGLLVLALLLFGVLKNGIGLLNPGFLFETPSRNADQGGIRPALLGSLLLGILIILISVPIGVGAALFLEEYAPSDKWWSRVIEINISNLAGVPSIVYGLLGLGVFNYLLKLGPVLLSGALTLSLLALPLIIVTARESIRAVPSSLRQASYAVGTTKWQTICNHVLPYAIPGILTGVILSVSRAIGETAPLIIIGAAGFLTFNPGLLKRFMALPITVYDYITRPEAGFDQAAAAAIIVLLLLIMALNGTAIYIRHRYSVLDQ